MAEKPPVKDAMPAATSKPVGNPAFNMMEEPLPVNTMPRKITIFLAGPPGDSIRVAREHFHEYVKPILVAGALDWEVIEGRREGEVSAGLAEKIRKLRKRNGESTVASPNEEDKENQTKDDLYFEMRKTTGIKEWEGVQGDLVLGRNTWKEYVRGLHEGWLGPLDPPKPPESAETILETSIQSSPEPSLLDTPSSYPRSESLPPSESALDSSSQANPPAPATPSSENPKPAKPSPTPPYISPSEYSSCHAPSFLVSSMQPVIPITLPHILGFLNTPLRTYRFLTKRRLADDTGRSVAALVLATHSRPYIQSADFVSAIDPDEASPSSGVVPEESVTQTGGAWEQEAVLRHEEREWHKSAWAASKEGEEDKERVWKEPMVIDGRIGKAMSQFELESGKDEEAIRVDEEKRRSEPTLEEKVRKWIGLDKKTKQGWDMGFEGSEDD
ncbi:hypothetical protein P7C71_g286, partial [Lecanoromycetidae sp. Uapishka_2]